MKWIAKATGDMTLSILDQEDKQVLKVDRLRENTLKAGNNGDILCRIMNDLQVIANFQFEKYEIDDETLLYPDKGLSPFPWSLLYDEKKRRITVKSLKKKNS